jgi:hypothetical protein
MSITSYTFTSLPLVHTLNLDFLGRRLWLCFLLVRESPRSANLRTLCLPNLISSRLPNFMISQVHGVESSRIRDFRASSIRDSRSLHVRDFGSFAGSRFQTFAHSRLWGFAGSRFQTFAHSRLFEASHVQDSRSSHICDFDASQVQDSRSSWVLCSWKFITRISYISTFRGWQVFLNSPTLAPRRSGLTLTIRFHDNLRISVKKRHPRNVRGDTRHPETSQRSNRGAFVELPPSPL